MDSGLGEVRLSPDKKGYQDVMMDVIRPLIQGRFPAAKKFSVSTSAHRKYTREFGVEVNILMTRLYGEERTRFGFDYTPDRKHFALKVYGMVYEFGSYSHGSVRKKPFLDWCAEYLEFEFVSVIDKTYNNQDNESRQPVVAYTMKTEDEMDEMAQGFCNRVGNYHPTKSNCFAFVKAALEFLDNPQVSPDSEVHKWISTYHDLPNCASAKTTQQRSVQNLPQYSTSNSYSTGNVAEIYPDSEDNYERRSSDSSDSSGNVIEIDLASDDNGSPGPVQLETTCRASRKRMAIAEIDLTYSDIDEYDKRQYKARYVADVTYISL